MAVFRRKLMGVIEGGLARGTQNRRLDSRGAHASPLGPALYQLWRTFQPVPQEGRSILIGVGQAATSVEITREREPDS